MYKKKKMTDSRHRFASELALFFEITSELAIIKLSWVRGHNHGRFRFTKIHQSITVYCMCYFFGNILSPFYFDSYISP